MNATDCSACAATDRVVARDFQELVASLDDIVFRFDERGRWTFLSPAWQKRLGWDAGRSLGRAAVRFVHPDERGAVLRNWTEVLAGRQEDFRREVRFRHADGGCRWMLVSARGLRDVDGRLHGVTGILADVSAAKAVEAELIAARAAAEVANKSKSEFLSTMSHELRTPLNAVIGLSESLLEAGAPFDPARTARYLGIIQASGKQLLAQINDILDLARIEAGRLQVNAEPFDARALCAGVLETAQREVRAKQLQVQLQTPPTPLLLNADERLLRQVVLNLVSNAVKFTPAKGRLTVTLEASAAGVRLSVADTGIGIAADQLGRLFKPFSQVDSSLGRQFGGTGLGLALVDRLTRLHGGTVAVASTPGAGSTFTVQLPPSVFAAGEDGPRDATPRARSVVLVDDDPNQHVLVGDYLRQRGFTVVHCDHARAAQEAIAAAEPGFAIVDVNLPGVSGLELIALLRQTPHGRQLPILAATALAEGEAAARCRAAGADAHLAKPISLHALAERIQRLTGLAA